MAVTAMLAIAGSYRVGSIGVLWLHSRRNMLLIDSGMLDIRLMKLVHIRHSNN